MIKKSITKKLLRYRSLLKKEGVRVTAMLLFGSQARGEARADSDIDVCVISSQFGKDRIAEGKRLHLIAFNVDPAIEPIPVTPKQLRCDKTSPLLHEIRKTGVKI